MAIVILVQIQNREFFSLTLIPYNKHSDVVECSCTADLKRQASSLCKACRLQRNSIAGVI